MLQMKDELMNSHECGNGYNPCLCSLNKQWQRLKREKTALQMTVELLTVRLNSVNEIVSLQEEKMAQVSVLTSRFLKCFLLFFFKFCVSWLSSQQVMMPQQITVWCKHSLRSACFRVS